MTAHLVDAAEGKEERGGENSEDQIIRNLLWGRKRSSKKEVREQNDICLEMHL